MRTLQSVSTVLSEAREDEIIDDCWMDDVDLSLTRCLSVFASIPSQRERLHRCQSA